MNWHRPSRRFFLTGWGGALAALPVLTSLRPRGARAAMTPARRFIAFAHDLGTYEKEWFPKNYMNKRDPASSFNESSLVGGGAAALSPISPISPILGEWLNRYRSKMLLFRGVDARFHANHDMGVALACTNGRAAPRNFTRRFSGNPAYLNPSIDQVLALSPKVYPEGEPLLRALTLATQSDTYSIRVSNGILVPAPNIYSSPAAAFSRLFGSGVPGGAESGGSAVDSLVVDRVLGDFRSLQANTRLSADDRKTLEEHVEQLFSLERRLKRTTSAGVCGADAPAPPAYDYKDPSNWGQLWDDYVDLMALGIRCGLTRIGTIGFPLRENHGTPPLRFLNTATMTFTESPHTYSHQQSWKEVKPKVLASLTWVTRVIARFLEKLDVVENPATGATYLDNSLVYYCNSQSTGHISVDLPLFTVGGLAGAFRTGRFVDFTSNVLHGPGLWKAAGKLVGTDLAGLHVTILQAFGLGEAEYTSPHLPPGWGTTLRQDNRREPLTQLLA